MAYSFSYKTESSLYDFYGENISEYPKHIELVTPETFVSDKETIEDAFEDFLDRDFGALWDVDPDVLCADGTYKNINKLPTNACMSRAHVNYLSKRLETFCAWLIHSVVCS